MQNGASARTFLHVSAFRKSRGRALLGSLVTYKIRRDDKGPLQATAAELFDAKPFRQSFAVAFSSAIVGLAFLFMLGYVDDVRFSNPDSTISASVFKIVSARDALRPMSLYISYPSPSRSARSVSAAANT